MDFCFIVFIQMANVDFQDGKKVSVSTDFERHCPVTTFLSVTPLLIGIKPHHLGSLPGKGQRGEENHTATFCCRETQTKWAQCKTLL